VADTPHPPPDSPSPFPWKPQGTAGPGRRALGRGLGALIPGADLSPLAGVSEIPVERIRANSLQPRAAFDQESLENLEASIREHGVLQPVLVRPVSGEMYEVIAGERRWRAAASSGLKTVPAIVRQMDDRGALEVALVENLQREDLNPVERARAYRRLLADFGLTQDDIARRVGRSQSSVANTLRLLGLPGEVLASLESGRITEGHARALLSIQERQKLLETWTQVEKNGWSVRATEIAARRASISREIRPRKRQIPRDISIIEQNISHNLGSPVRILTRARGGGEIRIAFFSHEDLERLMGLLAGRSGEDR
jgi:ParB family chromosome partitioning protein